MSLASPALLCVASGDAAVRAHARDLLASQGHRVVEAATLSQLGEAPEKGVRTALVDLRMPDLGGSPMAAVRAEPRLHRTRILALGEAEIRALVAPGPDPVLISLLLRIELQVAADRQVDLLEEVSRRLTALPEMEATIEALLDVVGTYVPSDTATLFMVDRAGNLEARAARGYELGDLVLRAMPIGQGIVGWVVANRAATIVGDSDIDTRFTSGGARGSRSMLAAPVSVGERVVGALTLVRRAPAEQFSDADLTLLATIGNSAGVALENARLFERERAVTERLLEVERTLGFEQQILRRLETYDRVYTQVVATVSHELKTPLMGIRGFAKLLADGEADAEETREFGKEIHDNAVRLSSYVGDILDEDAVHGGRVQLDVAAIDLKNVVADALRSLDRPARASGHVLVTSIAEGLPRVAGDADRLRQVVVNLVGNAIKYSPSGGRVEISATADAGHVVVTVDDEGVGIPPAERERVFDRFYRVSSEATRGISGTGLGLSIVRGIVDLHGGRIWIDSPPGGRGTRFCVALPQATGSERLAPAAAPAAVPHRTPAPRPAAQGRNQR
ncbi:MAG TPA: GAF domain-containing sensor histidine kinase, partial [Candidatus Dormibacteraeota bacterium]|nr:GAF domain-containing sensor histidine kinase [Candidatus Dormibacteraeota bacterium]